MRISDWSSDVCSSDLCRANIPGRPQAHRRLEGLGRGASHAARGDGQRHAGLHRDRGRAPLPRGCDGLRRSEERRVGKEWVSSVDLGGRRIIKKKRTKTKSAIISNKEQK